MTAPTRDGSGGSPVDLVAVQADHALLDALGRTGAVPWGWRASQGNARFTEALLAWRRACAGCGGSDHEPLVDVDTALAVVASQTTPTGPLTPRGPVGVTRPGRRPLCRRSPVGVPRWKVFRWMVFRWMVFRPTFRWWSSFRGTKRSPTAPPCPPAPPRRPWAR